MTVIKTTFSGCVLFLLILTLPVACFKNLTVTNIVYTNNFDNGQLNTITVSGWNNGSFGTLSNTRISNYNGSNVLGKCNNNQVQLTLPNLPPHQFLQVQFDLYLHNYWRNDLWKMTFDGSTQLLTGFSNDTTVLQSYPNWLGNGSALSPAGANSQTMNLPGICSLISSSHGTSLYRIVTTVAHSASSFALTFSDAGGNLNDTCFRSWSMDNLTVRTFNN